MQKVSTRVPLLTWFEFDPNNISNEDFMFDTTYLVLVEEHMIDGKIEHHIDTATAFGNYIDGFWDTSVDWIEGQEVHVIAYSDMSIDGKAGMFAVAKIGYKQAMLDLVSVIDANPDDDAKLREELMMLAVGNLAEAKNE